MKLKLAALSLFSVLALFASSQAAQADVYYKRLPNGQMVRVIPAPAPVAYWNQQAQRPQYRPVPQRIQYKQHQHNKRYNQYNARDYRNCPR